MPFVVRRQTQALSLAAPLPLDLLCDLEAVANPVAVAAAVGANFDGLGSVACVAAAAAYAVAGAVAPMVGANLAAVYAAGYAGCAGAYVIAVAAAANSAVDAASAVVAASAAVAVGYVWEGRVDVIFHPKLHAKPKSVHKGVFWYTIVATAFTREMILHHHRVNRWGGRFGDTCSVQVRQTGTDAAILYTQFARKGLHEERC